VTRHSGGAACCAATRRWRCGRQAGELLPFGGAWAANRTVFCSVPCVVTFNRAWEGRLELLVMAVMVDVAVVQATHPRRRGVSISRSDGVVGRDRRVMASYACMGWRVCAGWHGRNATSHSFRSPLFKGNDERLYRRWWHYNIDPCRIAHFMRCRGVISMTRRRLVASTACAYNGWRLPTNGRLKGVPKRLFDGMPWQA